MVALLRVAATCDSELSDPIERILAGPRKKPAGMTRD
jgi:hypothetical protein